MTAPSLVGPEATLSGHVEPRNDEVLAVFRNGRVEDIYAPGRRLRAVWRKYKPGALTYARVLRSDICFQSSVRNVALSDKWTLPFVNVTTFVALDSAGNYATLRTRLDTRGLTFMAALSAELTAEMDRFVRSLIASMSHEQMLTESRPDKWGANESLLHGLFVVDRVIITDIASDPHFQAIAEAEAGMLVDEAENERAEAMARRRGLSLNQWENPNRHAEQHELTLADMQARLEVTRIEHETRRAALEADARIKEAGLNNLRGLQQANRAGVGRDLTSVDHNILGIGGDTATPHVVDAVVVPEVDLPTTLGRDPRLVTQWARAGGQRSILRGAVEVNDDVDQLILLVLDGTQPASGPAEIASHAFPGISFEVLHDGQPPETWVRQLLQSRVDELDLSDASIQLDRDGDSLRIAVDLPNASGPKIVKALSGSGVLISEGLSALLDWDVIFELAQ